MTATDVFATKYPLHVKVRELEASSQVIGEFIEWLEAHGYIIAKYSDGDQCDPYLYESNASTEKLIAEFQGIDLKAFHAEKDAIYREMTAQRNQEWTASE